MQLSVLRTENLSSASNGQIVNLKGPGFSGNASTSFDGPEGTYDVTVAYHDENDGQAQLSVVIDGTSVDAWTLNQNIPNSSQANDANRMLREVASRYPVSNGDEIRINALQGNWDNANIDYIEFTPDVDQQVTTGEAHVALSGGDYSNPLEAIADLPSWCRPPTEFRECTLTIGPGTFELAETLAVPSGISLSGAGVGITRLIATDGLDVAVLVGDSEGAQNTVSDLTIENRTGSGTETVALRFFLIAQYAVNRIHAIAAGSGEVIAIDAARGEQGGTFTNVEAEALFGTEAVGIATAFAEIRDSTVRASNASSDNRAVTLDPGADGGRLKILGSEITARGGQDALGIAAVSSDATVTIADTRIAAAIGANSNVGLAVGSVDNSVDINDVSVAVRGTGASSNIGIRYFGSGGSDLARLSNVRSNASGGLISTGIELWEPTSTRERAIRISDSSFQGTGATNTNLGLSVLSGADGDIEVRRTTLTGNTASFTIDDNSVSRVDFSFTEFEGPLVIPPSSIGTLTCAAVVDQNNAFSAETCP